MFLRESIDRSPKKTLAADGGGGGIDNTVTSRAQAPTTTTNISTNVHLPKRPSLPCECNTLEVATGCMNSFFLQPKSNRSTRFRSSIARPRPGPIFDIPRTAKTWGRISGTDACWLPPAAAFPPSSSGPRSPHPRASPGRRRQRREPVRSSRRLRRRPPRPRSPPAPRRCCLWPCTCAAAAVVVVVVVVVAAAAAASIVGARPKRFFGDSGRPVRSSVSGAAKRIRSKHCISSTTPELPKVKDRR
mmetsp:Transcript_14895/g.33589  ORF Transcript_14895/g.33589 Transcript_14895/m.33589 type:complete len:245 (+) Transcript_14895:128-862(+)